MPNCSRCQTMTTKFDGGRFNEGHISGIGFLCISCQESVVYCEECEAPDFSGNLLWCGNCGVSVCSSCFESYHNHDYDDGDDYEADYDELGIHSYSYKPKPIFFPAGNKLDDLFLGVELEVSDFSSLSHLRSCATSLLDMVGNRIYLKEDGSLSNYSCEIVSHPAVLNYHLNNMPWPDILTCCKRNGGKSHNAGHGCGLHIHTSKVAFSNYKKGTLALNILKVIYVLEKFEEQFIKLSRRDPRYLDYCNPNKLKFLTNLIATTQKDREKELRGQWQCGRNQALNITSQTCEFRLWRGTLKEASFFATLELTNNLILACKKAMIKKVQAWTFRDMVDAILKFPSKYLETYIVESEVL